jgi:hypothetical protein
MCLFLLTTGENETVGGDLQERTAATTYKISSVYMHVALGAK